MQIDKVVNTIKSESSGFYLLETSNSESISHLEEEILKSFYEKQYEIDTSFIILEPEEKSKFITWSFTIARNKKIDFYRKNKKNMSNDDVRDFLYENEKSNDYEIESTINKITENLDQNQKKLIKMSFFEQKSHKIIAAELEIPLGTVKSRIRATLNKMQKHIL